MLGVAAPKASTFVMLEPDNANIAKALTNMSVASRGVVDEVEIITSPTVPPKPAGPVGNVKGSDQVKISTGPSAAPALQRVDEETRERLLPKNAAGGIGSIKIPHRKLGSRRGNIGSIEILFRRVDDVGSTIDIDDPPGYIPELYKDQRSKIRVVNPYKAQLEKIRILNGGKTDKFLAAAEPSGHRRRNDPGGTLPCRGDGCLAEAALVGSARRAALVARDRVLPGRLQTAVRRVLETSNARVFAADRAFGRKG